MKEHTPLQRSVLLLARKLLDSENGIPEDAYDQLLVVMERASLVDEYLEVQRRTDATDGMFYVSAGGLDDLIVK